MDKQQRKFLQMTEEPIEKLVPKLAVPTIISMLITTFYNMVDTFFVGKINTSAVGAVGVVFSFMTVIQAIGFFFGHGSGNYISFMLGRRKVKEAEEMASVGFFCAIATGILVMVIGLFCLDGLARFLGSTDTILPYTVDYLKYILIGAPYMTASLVLNNHLRFQGNAFYAMIGITSGAFLNIVLDPLFIFVFKLGVGGAALATIVSQFVGFCLLLAGTTKGGNIRIRISNFRPSKKLGIEILKGGTPSLMRQALTGISTVCLNRYAGIYGDAAIAAMSIVQRIMNFAAATLIGLGQGFQPVCGFSYGAGLYGRVKKAFWFCIKVGFVFLTVVAVAAFIGAPYLIELFRKGDPKVLEIGTVALRMQAMSLPVTSWVVISNMMQQNIGKVYKASFLAAARQGLILIPVLVVGSQLFGLLGIQIAQPIADVVTLVLAIVLQKQELDELDLLQARVN